MSTSRPPSLDDQAVERLLTGRSAPIDPQLQQVVEVLRSAGSGPAPRPTTALAELLAAGFEPQVVPLRRPAVRRPWALRTAAGLTAAAASLLVAGTAQALPAPLQAGLGDLVSAVTPFELPGAPTADDQGSPVPGRGTGTTTQQGPVPSPTPSAPGSRAPVPGAGAAPSAPATPSAAVPRTDERTEPRSTGASARTTVPHGSRAPAPEEARPEPRNGAAEAPPSQRGAARSTAPRGSAAPPAAAGTGQGQAGPPAVASPDARGGTPDAEPRPVSAGRR